MGNTTQGYLLIADITGYTQYLSESELEHAQAILTTLLELLVDHTRPPLVISRLAGDAVISYGLPGNFYNGQTFIEMIENTYVAFRRAIQQMTINNTCQCNACANISSLDLKFFLHYGTFAIQHISDHDELVGSDVNLIHRLLKNQVTETTGFRGYTLYTDAAIQQLGIPEIRELMVPHSESYEHLGQIQVWIQDMHPIWESKQATTHIQIPPDKVLIQDGIEINLSSEVLWDYLNHLDYRKTLLGSDRQELHNRSHGRVDKGSVYHCVHGDTVIPQTIVDWQPFERIVTQDVLPMPIPNVTALIEYHLVPTGSGTRLEMTLSKAQGPFIGRVMADRVIASMGEKNRKSMQAFKEQVEADQKERLQPQPGA
jgi:hypothetical protein